MQTAIFMMILLRSVGGFNDTDCDNETCSTELTTEEYFVTNATQTATPDVNTVKPVVRKRPILEHRSEYCPCNLKGVYCDINCCCDPDCSYDDKLAFSECLYEHSVYFDTRFCHSKDYIYFNNTPYIWKEENGLLCIYKENLPASYVIQADKPIKTVREAFDLLDNELRWPQTRIRVPPEFNRSAEMIQGSDLWIVRNNTEITNLRLPSSFLTNACLVTKPIKYLEDYESTCLQMQIDESNEALNVGSYFQNTTFISAPAGFNQLWMDNDLRDCPRNVCVSVVPYICKRNASGCFKIDKSNTSISCHFSYSSHNYFCSNLLRRIEYKIFHNGSHGIKIVELHATLADVTYSLRDKYELLQQFGVKYLWIDKMLNYSSYLSGNPGYAIGKPIICGVLKQNPNMTDKIERNPLDISSNFLILPENTNGFCELSNDSYVSVAFKHDLFHKCIIKINSSGCKEIQKYVFDLWSVPYGIVDLKKHVGMFGNANASIVSEWTELLYDFSPNETIKGVTGVGNACKNIANKLKISVLYSYVDVKVVKRQAKILGVVYSLENTDVVGSVDIFMEVAFYDVTKPSVRKFVDPPSFEIRIPSDLFYPFLIGGGSDVNVTFIFMGCLLLITLLVA